MMEQSFRLRQPSNSGQAMAGQANDKIQMSNKIQNPNVLKKEVNSPSTSSEQVISEQGSERKTNELP